MEKHSETENKKYVHVMPGKFCLNVILINFKETIKCIQFKLCICNSNIKRKTIIKRLDY